MHTNNLGLYAQLQIYSIVETQLSCCIDSISDQVHSKISRSSYGLATFIFILFHLWMYFSINICLKLRLNVAILLNTSSVPFPLYYYRVSWTKTRTCFSRMFLSKFFVYILFDIWLLPFLSIRTYFLHNWCICDGLTLILPTIPLAFLVALSGTVLHSLYIIFSLFRRFLCASSISNTSG